jgi:hypothetical protein
MNSSRFEAFVQGEEVDKEVSIEDILCELKLRRKKRRRNAKKRKKKNQTKSPERKKKKAKKIKKIIC